MGNFLTVASVTSRLPGSKVNEPGRLNDNPTWQINATEANQLSTALAELHDILRGAPDENGLHYGGFYGQTADPFAAVLAGLGTGRTHQWWDDTDDGFKFRESGVTVERQLFDDQGLGVLKLDSYAGATLAPAGKLWLRQNAGALQSSYNGGAWTAVGGGTYTGSLGVTLSGSDFRLDLTYAPTMTGAWTFHDAGIALTGTAALTSDGIVLVDSNLNRLRANRLAIASQAVGDILTADSTDTFARLALGSALQVLRVNAGGTALEYAAAGGGSGTVTSVAATDSTITISGTPTVAPTVGVALGNAFTWTAAHTFNQGLTIASGSKIAWSTDLFLSRPAAATLQFGDNSATPIAQTLRGAGGVGTDIAGGNFTIAAGPPSGSGNGGDVVFQTAGAGATGTTVRTLTDRWMIRGMTGGLIGHFVPAVNATYDVGYGGGDFAHLKPRNVYATALVDSLAAITAGTYITAGTSITATGDITCGKRLHTKQGPDVACAADITLGDGNAFDITGVSTLTRIASAGWTPGDEITLYFTGASAITDAVAAGGGYVGLQLNGGANVGDATGQSIKFRLTAASAWWRQVAYTSTN